jgi:hypothetical protein
VKSTGKIVTQPAAAAELELRDSANICISGNREIKVMIDRNV